MATGVDKWVTTDLERIVNGILCCANEHCNHHHFCGQCDFSCAKWQGYDVQPLVETIRKVLDAYEQRGVVNG